MVNLAHTDLEEFVKRDEFDYGEEKCACCGETFEKNDMHLVVAKLKGPKRNYSNDHYFCDECWADRDYCMKEVRKIHKQSLSGVNLTLIKLERGK